MHPRRIVFPSLLKSLEFCEEASQMDLYEHGSNSSFNYLYRYFCAWVHFMVLVLCNNDGCMLGPTLGYLNQIDFWTGLDHQNPKKMHLFFFFFKLDAL